MKNLTISDVAVFLFIGWFVGYSCSQRTSLRRAYIEQVNENSVDMRAGPVSFRFYFDPYDEPYVPDSTYLEEFRPDY